MSTKTLSATRWATLYVLHSLLNLRLDDLVLLGAAVLVVLGAAAEHVLWGVIQSVILKPRCKIQLQLPRGANRNKLNNVWVLCTADFWS